MPIRTTLSPRYIAAAAQKARQHGKRFDSFPEQMVITDANAVILYANPAAEHASRFSAQEMLGKNPADLWGGRMPRAFYEKMWRTIKERKEPFVGQIRNIRRDGSEQWQELYITPLLDDRGDVQYFVGIEYALPTPPLVVDKGHNHRRKAALLFMRSPQNMLLVVVGRTGAKFYRLGSSGLQSIGEVEKTEDAPKTGVFLRRAKEALAAVTAQAVFDQTYLFVPPGLATSWQSIVEKSGAMRVTVMLGDYSGNSGPQLLQHVRLHLYGNS